MDQITQCHECGLLQRNPPVPAGGGARCRRCGCTLHRSRPDSLERTLALTVAGLVLFVIANTFPFLTLEMQGGATETTLASGVLELYHQGEWQLSAVVLFTSILAPGLQLGLLLTVLLPLRFGSLPPSFGVLFRYVKTLTPWGMMDVFLLGILVSVVKLASIAGILPGVSLFAFVLLIFVLAAAQASLDPDIVWSHIPLPDAARRLPEAGETVLLCHVCELTVASGALSSHPNVHAASSTPENVSRGPHQRFPHPVPLPEGEGDPEHARRDFQANHAPCPRCGGALHRRKPHSIERTWAFIVASLICLAPANLLPIMRVTSLGQIQSDTIMSGVIYLFQHEMWPLAVIVFVASVFVPLMKLSLLVYLAASVQLRSRWRPRERIRLYRITEAVGRWSMVDIYVVAILVTMVQLGNLATIEAGPGAVFFAAVVVLTMFAAMAFDPRLIWDNLEHANDGAR